MGQAQMTLENCCDCMYGRRMKIDHQCCFEQGQRLEELERRMKEYDDLFVQWVVKNNCNSYYDSSKDSALAIRLLRAELLHTLRQTNRR